ncbi:hypothetical protein A8144_12360 [Mycobacterium leprae 3125609]|nr:hypothetical protein A8144_12360 [Mycobacterium leprae 3125609]OAX70422.1 hypothetical protein A3216_12030 [Mycobacterium leprae 7935681]
MDINALRKDTYGFREFGAGSVMTNMCHATGAGVCTFCEQRWTQHDQPEDDVDGGGYYRHHLHLHQL